MRLIKPNDLKQGARLASKHTLENVRGEDSENMVEGALRKLKQEGLIASYVRFPKNSEEDWAGIDFMFGMFPKPKFPKGSMGIPLQVKTSYLKYKEFLERPSGIACSQSGQEIRIYCVYTSLSQEKTEQRMRKLVADIVKEYGN